MVWLVSYGRNFTDEPAGVRMREEYRKKRGLVQENTDLRKQVADLKQAALERRRVEDGLRHDRDLLRLLLDEAPHPLCLLAADGAPLLANRPFVELLGYASLGEMIRIGDDLGLLVGTELPAAPTPGQAQDLTFRRSNGETIVAAAIASTIPGTTYLAITVLATPQTA